VVRSNVLRFMTGRKIKKNQGYKGVKKCLDMSDASGGGKGSTNWARFDVQGRARFEGGRGGRARLLFGRVVSPGMRKGAGKEKGLETEKKKG